MPRPGPRRPSVAFRLEGVDVIDALAAERGESRSETIRVLLVFAQRHMPRGWTP